MNVLYWVGRTVGFVLALAAATAHAGSYEELFFALRGDDAATVRALQEREFDPNTRNLHGQVGLYVALQNESFAAAQVLMAHPKLQVDAVNTAGESPLMIAALKGQLSWCQRLFDRGASVELAGRWSPLHYAATGPEPKVVQQLLDHGAHIDAESPNRSTPLMMAAPYGSEASAHLLIDRGAAPKPSNDRTMTAADFARSVGRTALALQLDKLAR